jgi:hypothetical protein
VMTNEYVRTMKHRSHYGHQISEVHAACLASRTWRKFTFVLKLRANNSLLKLVTQKTRRSPNAMSQTAGVRREGHVS